VLSPQLSIVVLGWELCLISNFVEFKVCLQVDNKGISIVMLVQVVLRVLQCSIRNAIYCVDSELSLLSIL
jgi:hypothetical protein